ncbi:NAD-dependent deacetylase [Weissella oryzae SG25]|uniref:protein acetyllysine N-acetyltransferase n=1 Tax=Weissella oryzae (strain DSM 25784 / JCM 18191 / LMG 30913 / SG25) TaxID=1329250 RepID=A0A069CR40_WEIOS|nr:NAD-dependent protein deacylase [Weissella oryzae]GAK30205.1 NAD-dependent deacetylase [Weissella oryzae SG25]
MITKEIQKQFDEARQIVFLTGAGVSTASGIPDYRSKNGIYQGLEQRPEYLLSTEALHQEPAAMYNFMKEYMYFPEAKPNIIHKVMAELTKQGRARIITQNVDGLHEKSGAQQVLNYHGSLYNIYGVVTGQRSTVEAYMQSMYAKDGELLRPGITLYGEIPFRTEEAALWMQQADLVVIVGTSFVVYPFAGLLQYVQPGVPILAINLEKIDTLYPVKQLIGDAGSFFKELKI